MKNTLNFIILLMIVGGIHASDLIEFKSVGLTHSDTEFRIPSGWQKREKITEAADYYLFAPEFTDEQFGHDTGFLIMVYKNIKKKTGSSASSIAEDIDSWVINSLKCKLIESGPKQVGPFRGSIAKYESSDKNVKYHEMHLGNDEKDIIWMLKFTSPAEEWKENWEGFGYTIFKHIQIDDEY